MVRSETDGMGHLPTEVLSIIMELKHTCTCIYMYLHFCHGYIEVHLYISEIQVWRRADKALTRTVLNKIHVWENTDTEEHMLLLFSLYDAVMFNFLKG